MDKLLKKKFKIEAPYNTLSILIKEKYNWEKYFMFNLLDCFYFLEELKLSLLSFGLLSTKILKSNLQNLESLHTVKLHKIILEFGDISVFLWAKNLSYLKLTKCDLAKANLDNFSEKIKTSRLERLTLKNISFYKTEDEGEIKFLSIIEAVSSPRLKTL